MKKIILLLFLFSIPSFVYSQYTYFEISDISFYSDDKVRIEETRLLRNRYIGTEIKLIEYPDSDIIEIDGLKRILNRYYYEDFFPDNIISLKKKGTLGVNYENVKKHFDYKVSPNKSIDINSIIEFSYKYSYLFQLSGSEFSFQVSFSEEGYNEEADLSFSSYKIKVDMKIIND